MYYQMCIASFLNLSKAGYKSASFFNKHSRPVISTYMRDHKNLPMCISFGANWMINIIILI